MESWDHGDGLAWNNSEQLAIDVITWLHFLASWSLVVVVVVVVVAQYGTSKAVFLSLPVAKINLPSKSNIMYKLDYLLSFHFFTVLRSE